MSTFSKVKCKDYKKKRNILRNNVPKWKRYRMTLYAGGGVLPKSKKNRVCLEVSQ